MESSDDEMLFDQNLTLTKSEPFVADRNDPKSQHSNHHVKYANRKRSRASRSCKQQSNPRSSPSASKDIDHDSPIPPRRSTVHTEEVADELTSPSSKRDRYGFIRDENMRDWLIARIEDIFEKQVDGVLANDADLSLTINLRPRDKAKQPQGVVRHIQFPGKSEKDAWRYTAIIRILELIHGALVDNNIITKRAIFYQDPALFLKQDVVDRFVDDLAFSFGVPRMLMNVTATAKGLIAGNFMITRSDGAIRHGKTAREGFLISPLQDNERISLDEVRWVLVVEKDATFCSLVSSSFWDCLSSHGLLVTGKGFPDIATRLMLRLIARSTERNDFAYPPVYGLMDYDPDGLDILSTYKHGSAALSHETDHLEVPSIKWLGLRSLDVGDVQNLHKTQGLLRSSARDRRKAVKMLERETWRKEDEWKSEVQRMLMLNVKAEIQVLDARDGGIVGWLGEHGIL